MSYLLHAPATAFRVSVSGSVVTATRPADQTIQTDSVVQSTAANLFSSMTPASDVFTGSLAGAADAGGSLKRKVEDDNDYDG